DQSRAAFLDKLRTLATPAICTVTGAAQARLSLDEAGQLLNSKVAGDLTLVTGEAPYDALVELWFTELDAATRGRERLRAWKDQAFGPDEITRWEDALLREHVVVMPPPPAFGVEEGQT